MAPTLPGGMERSVMAWQVNQIAETAANDHAAKREAVYEEQQFANKFNHLLDTLRDFANQYNHHVIDVKKLKALKKAWRDLEKTDAWFRLDEHSSQ